MKQEPFWVDDHTRPEGITSDLPAETDYLIVGSGLTGLSAALRLAGAGNDVTVIDAGDIGGGASSINGGMVSPDVKAGIRTVFEKHGPAIGREMWSSTVRSVGLVRELATRLGVEALTHDGGMAALGRGSKQRHNLEASVTWYRQHVGTDWELLVNGDVDKVVGGGYFDVALYEPEGFGVHPARLVFGLAQEAVHLGTMLVDNCEAASLEHTTTGVRVVTSKGTINAGNVILATNGYTTLRPSRAMARLVVPVGSYIIVTEPIGDRADQVFPGGAMSYTRRRLLNYMRRTHDDRILLGGRRSLHTGLDLGESADDLRRSLITYWPDLKDVPISHVWGGRLGIPFDLTPHIGRVDGVWYAMGYAGHGVGLSCQLGHELAGMLLGVDPPSVYSQIPHNGRFYYSGNSTWFLTPASYLYRVLDKIGI